MKVELVRISPQLASKMLEGNDKNRSLSKSHVQTLASQMKSGQWKRNGESLKLSKSGKLLDGQHRLHAVILSGETIEMIVTHDLDDDVFTTLDTGKKRNGADALSIEKVKNPNVVAGAIKIIKAYENGLNLETGGYLSRIANNQATVEFEREHNIGELSNQACTWYAKNKIITPSQFLFLYYTFSAINQEDAFNFLEKLSGGAGLAEKHPVKVLRDKIIKHKSSALKLPQPQLFHIIFKAWNHFRAGTEITQIALFKEDDKPLVLR